MESIIKVKINPIFSLVIILFSCGNVQNRQPDEELAKLVVIKDFNATKQGFGQNVVAEIENNSSKKIKFVSVEFTWYDRNGGLITSQNGNTTDVSAKSTAIVDSYFDEMPEGSTYKARIKDLVFY